MNLEAVMHCKIFASSPVTLNALMSLNHIIRKECSDSLIVFRLSRLRQYRHLKLEEEKMCCSTSCPITFRRRGVAICCRNKERVGELPV